MKKITFTLLMLLGISAFAQDSLLVNYAEGISLDELKEHVQILASSDFEGRGTGDKGQRLASEYLKEQFKLAGLQGASDSGDPYYQEFQLKKSGGIEIQIIAGSDTLSSQQHLEASGDLPSLDGNYEVLFIGYGIDEELYSDYKNIDVQGKIVAFLAGEPSDKTGKYLLNNSYLPKYTDRGVSKAEMAKEKGAVLALRIDPEQERAMKMVNMIKRFSANGQLGLIEENQDKASSKGLVHIGIDDAARIFGAESDDILKVKEKLDKGKAQSGSFKKEVFLNVNSEANRIETENIVAFIEGTDLKDEWIVITAHFDHLGKRGDDIYYGADDNATGTAAVVEIAEAFAEMAKDGIRTRRSILFMPVSGEERGLLGSKYYVNNPLFPINKTKAALNMDMIGRTDKNHTDNPNYVKVYVSDSEDSQLAELTKRASENELDSLQAEFKYKKNGDYLMRGSDHFSFEEKGVPVLYFFCGLHPDYHRPTDTWNKVEYEKFTNISRLVFYSACQLADHFIE